MALTAALYNTNTMLKTNVHVTYTTHKNK